MAGNDEIDRLEVEDNRAQSRYEIKFGKEAAVAVYRLEEPRIVFTHTVVPVELEGHGIAGKLVKSALEDARQRHLTVVPLCPYVASFITRHQEYLDLVDPTYKAQVTRA